MVVSATRNIHTRTANAANLTVFFALSLNFLHISAISLSRRHEKFCQVAERFFVVFHLSIETYREAEAARYKRLSCLYTSVLKIKSCEANEPETLVGRGEGQKPPILTTGS